MCECACNLVRTCVYANLRARAHKENALERARRGNIIVIIIFIIGCLYILLHFIGTEKKRKTFKHIYTYRYSIYILLLRFHQFMYEYFISARNLLYKHNIQLKHRFPEDFFLYVYNMSMRNITCGVCVNIIFTTKSYNTHTLVRTKKDR